MRIPARTDSPDKILDSLISIVGSLRSGHLNTGDSVGLTHTLTADPSDPSTFRFTHTAAVLGVDENFSVLCWPTNQLQGPYYGVAGKNRIVFTLIEGLSFQFDLNWIAIRR